MTSIHFCIAFFAILARIEDNHGLRWVAYVSGALALASLSAREPRLPRQPVDAVARRATAGTGDGLGAARARPALGAADARGEPPPRARARDPWTLGATGARLSRV